MKVIHSIKVMQNAVRDLRRKGRTIGFVPTMGYFHQGHLKLMEISKRENDVTIVSVFVNPMQFGPDEDFDRYPRDKKRDESFAKALKVDIIFSPTREIMYPDGYRTSVEVARMTDVLCGAFRPGHFHGVTTVVSKLLNIVQPDRLYLGQKDAQQAVVLERMVKDLNFSLTVKTVPTVRELDGLAMSSRNAYLSDEHRKEAVWLYKALQHARRSILDGERRPRQVEEQIKKMIEKNTSGKVEYIHCVKYNSLESADHLEGPTLIALAVCFGRARLIDNIIVRVT